MKIILKKEHLNLETMDSGHLSLNLTSNIDWEQFPDFADKFAHEMGGIIEKKTDAVDVRIWGVLIQGESVRLVFDDFPVMVSLESTSDKGDMVLRDVKSHLESMLGG